MVITLIRKLPAYKYYGLSPLNAKLLPSYGVALAVTALATSLRWALDGVLPPGFPFVTFFPAIVLVAFTVGYWPGLLAAILGFFISWYLFLPPAFTFALSHNSAVALGFYVFVAAIDLFLLRLTLRAIHEADAVAKKNHELSEFRGLLISELDHRIKNLFTITSSVVKLSARDSETPSDMAQKATDRIMALSRSHTAFWLSNIQEHSTVQAVASKVLEPYTAQFPARIHIECPSPPLEPGLIQTVSLVLHELATNSVKYGALHSSAGQIYLSTTSFADTPHLLTMRWYEDGVAPPKEPATGGGFGSQLIARLLKSIGAQFQRSFVNDAMQIVMEIPLGEAREGLVPQAAGSG